MDTTLRELENETIYVLRETARAYPRAALLWSMGKDSTTLLWIARKAFFGDIPFTILHIDTSYKFADMYAFRDRWAREWSLRLKVHRNEASLAAGMSPDVGTKLACCKALKTDALRQAIDEGGFSAVLAGIRADEHGVRAKERVFSPRDADFRWNYQDQPPELWDLYVATAEPAQHMRVHPLLGWRELDVWRYVEDQRIPLPELYRSKGGKRYRSIGCERCCQPIDSQAVTVPEILHEIRVARDGERAGRAQDKEDAATMQKLRALGYM